MIQPNVLILRAPGTNCDFETAYAFEEAGAKTERIHINRLLENPEKIEEFQIIALPGGFSYGDDIAAGRILANQVRHHLSDLLFAFKDAGKLILGICNGFQILIKSGLLLPDDEQGAPATLTWNRSGVYTDRWVRLRCDGNKSVFLQGIDSLYLPIAHAEGKLAARDEATLDRLQNNGQLALRYLAEDNPNGAVRDVAGICDETGCVLGLMPHPERFIDPTQHPRWTREKTPPAPHQRGDGFALFQNAVNYFGN